ETGPFDCSPLTGRGLLLLLLLLLLLCCFLHRNILPNIKVCGDTRHDVVSMYKASRRKSQEKNAVRRSEVFDPGSEDGERGRRNSEILHSNTGPLGMIRGTT